MSHIKLLLLLTSLSCLSLHCKKEEPSELSKLPPITNIGAQTFGCLINGKAWTAEYGQVQIDFFNDELFITVDKQNIWGIDESIAIHTYDGSIRKPGQYFIPFNADLSCFGVYNSILYLSPFPVNQSLGGFITITRMDTINYYMAGTFNFTLFDETGTSQLNVTEGRFDYKYH